MPWIERVENINQKPAFTLNTRMIMVRLQVLVMNERDNIWFTFVTVLFVLGEFHLVNKFKVLILFTYTAPDIQVYKKKIDILFGEFWFIFLNFNAKFLPCLILSYQELWRFLTWRPGWVLRCQRRKWLLNRSLWKRSHQVWHRHCKWWFDFLCCI